jgi:hypothetical protein
MSVAIAGEKIVRLHGYLFKKCVLYRRTLLRKMLGPTQRTPSALIFLARILHIQTYCH